MTRNSIFILTVALLLTFVKNLKIDVHNIPDVNLMNEVYLNGNPVSGSVTFLQTEIESYKTVINKMNSTIVQLEEELASLLNGGSSFIGDFIHLGVNGHSVSSPYLVLEYMMPPGDYLAYIFISLTTASGCNYGTNGKLLFDGVEIGSSNSNGKWYEVPGDTYITVTVTAGGSGSGGPCYYISGSGQILGFA